MNAAEKMDARIKDLEDKRNKERVKIATEITKWEAAREKALEVIATFSGDPDKVQEYAAAKVQADYTAGRIEELRQKLGDKFTLISITPDESRQMIKLLKSDAKKRNIKAAEELIALYRRIFTIETEMGEAEKRDRLLLGAWKDEADPTCEPAPVTMFDHWIIRHYLDSENHSITNGIHGIDDNSERLAEIISNMKRPDFE